MSELVEQGIESVNSGTTLIITDDPSSSIWRQAADIEAEVFIERGYVATAEELAEEYAPYLGKSSMIAAIVGGNVVGSGRVIHYDPQVGFKTLKDVEKGRLTVDSQGRDILVKVPLEKVMEIGTLSIEKAYRGMRSYQFGLNIELYGAILEVGRRAGSPYILASFDDQYFRRFMRYFGPAVKQLGPAVDYMGTPTIPAIMNMEDAYVGFKERGLAELVHTLDDAGHKLSYEHRPINTAGQ